MSHGTEMSSTAARVNKQAGAPSSASNNMILGAPQGGCSKHHRYTSYAPIFLHYTMPSVEGLIRHMLRIKMEEMRSNETYGTIAAPRHSCEFAWSGVLYYPNTNGPETTSDPKGDPQSLKMNCWVY